MKAFAALLVAATLSAIAHAQAVKSGPWEMQQSGTTANLRGIHAVGGGVAWASGANGTVLRTEDSGYMWQSCAMPPGAENLDFRGIWAWDANTAIVMSSGPGDQSRLYKTTDGCSHWMLLYISIRTRTAFGMRSSFKPARKVSCWATRSMDVSYF